MADRSDLTIDLVMGTRGRIAEPRRFLEALAAQTSEARLIVVDQNPDDRLGAVIADFDGVLDIVHLRSEGGVSRARNAALPILVADIVAFPDDDCWYPPDFLRRVRAFFIEYPMHDGVHGRGLDEQGRPSGGRGSLEPGPMTRYNLWKLVGTYLLFVRRSVVDEVGPFDESLGLNAPWGAGEDLDYVVRSLTLGFSIAYEPALVVHHPRRRERTGQADIAVGYDYGLGMGRAMRKARLPVWFSSYLCGRAFAGAGLALIHGRPNLARFHWSVGQGRLRGWLRSTPGGAGHRSPTP